MTLDLTDKKLLNLLQENSKLSKLKTKLFSQFYINTGSAQEPVCINTQYKRKTRHYLNFASKHLPPPRRLVSRIPSRLAQLAIHRCRICLSLRGESNFVARIVQTQRVRL